MGSKTEQKSQTPEEMAAKALNEQGFLFSQRIRELIRYGNPGKEAQTAWRYEEKEYPVTAANGSQTRIDILLRNIRRKGVYVCIECKRSHPEYKQWMFFDEDRGIGGAVHGTLFFETFQVTIGPNREKQNGSHRIQSCPAPKGCPIFSLYLEVAINRQGKAGYTETIEEALLQVIKGHTGLMAKILFDFESESAFCSVPLVVTTAQLMAAKFDIGKVNLELGTIEAADLELEPLNFCAVTYHPNDDLAIRSPYINLSAGRASVQQDITNWQTRTVFVVQSQSIIDFLDWLDNHIFEARPFLNQY